MYRGHKALFKTSLGLGPSVTTLFHNNSNRQLEIMIINSVLHYQCAASAVRRLLMDTAQEKDKILNITK